MINWKLVNFCEFDKYAIKSYCAIHNVSEDLNLGDITKVDETKLADFNCMTWGFPCTDISVAGKQAGFIDENGNKTRSGMYYEGMRILREKKPAISIIENVKNLVGKKFKAEFEQILSDLDNAGYNSYWKVLNAKDYGIPQNRERVFIISIRKDLDNGLFKFPQSFDNGIRLKDMLEDEVDEKYYISEKATVGLLRALKRPHTPTMLNEDSEFSPTLDTRVGALTHRSPYMCIPCITPDREEKRQNGRRFKEDGEPMFTITSQDRHGVLQVGNIVETGNWKNPQRGRIYHPNGCSPSLNTVGGGGLEPKILEDYRIRKLTPKECFRLMGFSDEDFNAAQSAGVSNSQLYKQAGNSIVVDVLFYILLELYQAMPHLFNDLKLSSFFSGIGAFEKALDRLEEYINMKLEDEQC